MRNTVGSCSHTLKSFFGIGVFHRRSGESSSRSSSSSSPCSEPKDVARQLHDTGIWRDAPVLTGTTKFPPLDDAKNILITGGAGFIGCWVVRHLTLTYPHYNIISFDKLEYCASLNNTRALNSCKNFTFVLGDITSSEAVSGVLKKYNIDTIFHFAAQSHVDHSFGNSYEFTSTNVYGTHVLLECAKNHSLLKRFIHVSTDEVYGEVAADAADLTEDSVLAPTNPYAASKAAAEMLVHSYWKSFKLPIMVVRSNNVYGPHQFPEKIIPKFALLMQRGEKLQLHGDGKHTRRHLYAGDAAEAFDTILHRGKIGEVYNVGSAHEMSNLELCAHLLREFGHDPVHDFAALVEHTVDRPFNDRRYAVDATKLQALGWRQKTPFAQGLRTTVEWYRRFGGEWWGDLAQLESGYKLANGSANGAVTTTSGKKKKRF